MDLLKFMITCCDSSSTKREIVEWNQLTGKQAYSLCKQSIKKGLVRIETCPNSLTEKQMDEFIEGLCNDLKEKGFEVEKVLDYIKQKNKLGVH